MVWLPTLCLFAMQDARQVAAAVPASHGLRVSAAAFRTLYGARLVTGATCVAGISFAALLAFSAVEQLRHAAVSKAAELGVFLLTLGAGASAPLDHATGQMLGRTDFSLFQVTAGYAFVAVLCSIALWHAAVHANSGLLTQRATLMTALFSSFSARHVFLLLADTILNVVSLFSALYLGGSLQLTPQECMTPGEISVEIHVGCVHLSDAELEAHVTRSTLSSAHAADADLWEGIAADVQTDTHEEAHVLDVADVTGCFALPDIILPALVACLSVSFVSWLSMLTGGHRAHGQYTHRWHVMARLTDSLLDMQQTAHQDEEEHWQAVSSPQKRAKNTDSILDDTVDDLLDVSPTNASFRAASAATAGGNASSSCLGSSAATAASSVPLMAPARLLPGSPLQPAVPSDFLGLAHRVLGAPVDLLKAAADEWAAAAVLGCAALCLFAGNLAALVQWAVDRAPAVLPAQQWQLRVPLSSAAVAGGHEMASLAAAVHFGGTAACIMVLVMWLTVVSNLRRVLLAMRMSVPWGVDTVLFGMPLAREKAQVNWGAKPITKPVASVEDDPLSPVGQQPPGAFSPASLGMDAGQVDGFSVRFATATAAPAGSLAAYLTGWSARGVRATLLADGLWRPSTGVKGGSSAQSHSTSFRATASGLLPAGADAAAAECALAWSHRMRDGQLALYAGAVRAVAAPPSANCLGGAQAGSRMRQGAVTHSLARSVPVVTPAAAAHGSVGIVADLQAPVPVLHAVALPSGPFLPHLTAADVNTCAPAHILGRSLMWQDWAMAMQRNSFDLAEVVGDASGNRLSALVWAGTACLDALSLSLQAAAVDEEAPSAAGSKSISSMGGGLSPHAPAFVASFVRSLAAYDPVTSQAKWLAGGQAVASTRACATALVGDLPQSSSTPGRPAARGRSPSRSAAARAVSLMSPDGHLDTTAGRGSSVKHTQFRMRTPAGSRLNASGADMTSGGLNGTLMNTMNASRLGGSEVGDNGLAYLAVEPAAAFDYVQHTAAVPGSGLSVQEGVMLCEVAPTYSAEEMSMLLAPDATQGLDFSVNSTMSARLTRSMAWSAVGSPSLGGQWNASNASRLSAATGEMAVSESSLLLRLAAMAVQDAQPGAKYGLLGSVARLFIRSPAQERSALLWDGENCRHAADTLAALCSKGMKKDKSGALQRHLCVVVSSITTLYASARAYALSRACAGADGIAAEQLAVMGSVRVNGAHQVTGSNPARALRRARIVIASLAYRQPLLLAILLQMRSSLVQLLQAWGGLLLDPAVCPLPPLPRVVLAHVHADMKHGIPMGVELAELMD